MIRFDDEAYDRVHVLPPLVSVAIALSFVLKALELYIWRVPSSISNVDPGGEIQLSRLAQGLLWPGLPSLFGYGLPFFRSVRSLFSWTQEISKKNGQSSSAHARWPKWRMCVVMSAVLGATAWGTISVCLLLFKSPRTTT